MKILLLGNTGQLGWELQRTLQPLGVVVALDYPNVNMADAVNIRKTVQEHHPQIIVNATAYTAVDKAESEPELALAINSTGPGVLAEEAHKMNAVLVHYSTDYVFDGTKGSPYVETDPPHPLNVYGESKLIGEQAIQQVGGTYLIFRTAWVYSMHRDNFVSKVLGWSRKNATLRIVDDQVSNPTWARMLAEISTISLARAGDDFLPWLAERKGLYHLAGDGFASRYEWVKEILKLDPNAHEQVTKELVPAATGEFPAPAKRPLFSAVDCAKFKDTFGLQLPAWNLTLALAM
jgi:dTDP-4-dehydrorhamnose reductase